MEQPTEPCESSLWGTTLTHVLSRPRHHVSPADPPR
jgi:hypothetical protein